MLILNLEELSHVAVEKLDRNTTLLLLSVSPLEEHGPHLPLGVDIFNAEYFAQELARRWVEARPQWTVVLLPPLVAGSYAFDAPGTVSVRASVIRDLVYDYGASLARHGFRYFFLSNGHGGPTHLVALEEACRAVERRYGMKMVSLSSSMIPAFFNGAYLERIEQYLGRPLTAAEREMMRRDSHGGFWETSVMLKLRPELVGKDYAGLEPFAPPWLARLRKNYATRGGRAGYVGYPAAASREFAEASLAALMDVAYEKMARALDSHRPESRSALYHLPFLRPDFKRSAGLAAALLGAAALGYWLARRKC